MLQEQISLLVSNAAVGLPSQQQASLATPVSASIPDQMTHSPSPSRDRPSEFYARHRSRAARHPQYVGPTSSAFGFGVAQSSLQEMGIHPATDLTDNTLASLSTTPARSPVPWSGLLLTQDALLCISQNQALRLIEIYEEECNSIYPFIDTDLLVEAARNFYKTKHPAHSTSTVRGSVSENMLSGGILDILRLVVAIALVFENYGPTPLSLKLLDTVEHGFDGRLCGHCVDILEIQAWTLMVCSSTLRVTHLAHIRAHF